MKEHLLEMKQELTSDAPLMILEVHPKLFVCTTQVNISLGLMIHLPRFELLMLQWLYNLASNFRRACLKIILSVLDSNGSPSLLTNYGFE